MIIRTFSINYDTLKGRPLRPLAVAGADKAVSVAGCQGRKIFPVQPQALVEVSIPGVSAWSSGYPPSTSRRGYTPSTYLHQWCRTACWKWWRCYSSWSWTTYNHRGNKYPKAASYNHRQLEIQTVFFRIRRSKMAALSTAVSTSLFSSGLWRCRRRRRRGRQSVKCRRQHWRIFQQRQLGNKNCQRTVSV